MISIKEREEELGRPMTPAEKAIHRHKEQIELLKQREKEEVRIHRPDDNDWHGAKHYTVKRRILIKLYLKEHKFSLKDAAETANVSTATMRKYLQMYKLTRRICYNIEKVFEFAWGGEYIPVMKCKDQIRREKIYRMLSPYKIRKDETTDINRLISRGVKAGIEELQISYSEFVQATGIPLQTFIKVKKGGKGCTLNTIEKTLRYLGYDIVIMKRRAAKPDW